MSTDLQIETELRAASLDDLVALLRHQKDVGYDIVVPAHDLSYVNGRLHIKGGAARVSDDGVTSEDAVLNPTPIFDDGIADRLKIPRDYHRRLRAERTQVAIPEFTDGAEREISHSLLDLNVNGHLQSFPASKRFLIRGFRTDDPDEYGIARSIHSNRFGAFDNLDLIVGSLKGMRAAYADQGKEFDPSKFRIYGDLSERSFRLVVVAPEVTALAPVLLANYKNPFGEHGRRGRGDEGLGFVADATGERLPIVEAGFCVTNSEVGGGAAWRYPYINVRTCGNGAVHKAHGIRQVHAGTVLDDGVIDWGDDTRRNALEAFVLQTRDAVKTWLSPEYVASVVAEIEQTSGTPVDDIPATLERVAQTHLFTESEQAAVLDMFIKGGDLTAGGVMQAVTAAAQTLDSPDRAVEFEEMAFDVLATAAAV
jgi:hypothetical protein